MPRYNLNIACVFEGKYLIEADNKQEATALAEELLASGRDNIRLL